MTQLKYWTLVTLDGTGDRKTRELKNAQSFIVDTFRDFTNPNEITDTAIQQRLLEFSRDPSSQQSLLAQRCLLCFISWQIEQVCLQLARQFGEFHGFTHRDLLPYVLDDDGSLQPSTTYQSLAREILQSYDCTRSSLSSWISQKVKQHKPLNKFLLECGLYLVSDWAILNDTQPQQLPKIFSEYYSLTLGEIEQAQKILEAYHSTYRSDRWQQRAKGVKGKCNPPTTEQLQQMAKILETKGLDRLSADTVMVQLQNLADKLRQYRTHVRGGLCPTDSLDAHFSENSALIERVADPETANIMTDNDDTEDFLKSYRKQMLACFDQALDEVTKSRLKKIQKKDKYQASKFLQALQLFHCQRLTMSQIAQQLGLDAQYKVTRLLKLKEFRADVGQKTVEKLQKSVMNLAKEYVTPDSLVNLEKQIAEALDEQMYYLIEQAEKESTSMQSNLEISLFSKRLCENLGFQYKEIFY